MKKFFEIIIDYPILTMLATLAVTVFFALQLPKLRLETDVDVYFPDDHPIVEYEDLIEEIFNYQESLVVAIFNEGPNGVFNPQTLAKIKRMTEEIALVKGVIAQREEDVKSISSMDNIIGTADSIEVIPLMEEIPTTPEEIQHLKDSLYGNEMFSGWIASKDQKAAVILAKIERTQEEQVRAYLEIKDIVEKERGDGDVIYLAGQPVLEATFVEYIMKNIQVTFPMVVAVIAVLLFVSLGNLRGVVLPLMVVLVSVIWSMGVMSLVKIPLYDLTSTSPIILIAIGCAYGIHILNRYQEEIEQESDREPKEVVLQTMLTIWQPVVMSSLTTVVGFVSLCTSSLMPVKCFGIFTGIGIFCALIFSFTSIPAGLSLMKLPKVSQEYKDRGLGVIVRNVADRWLDFSGRFVYRNRIAICIFFVLLAVLSGIGFTKLRANDSWIEMFPHDSEVYTSTRLIGEKMSGTLSMNVVIEGEEPDTIKSPSILRKMEGIQKVAEEAEMVGDSISIVDYIKRMNKVMNADKEEFNTIPDSREAIAQYLLLYSLSGDPDDFDEVVDYDYRQANITIMLKDDQTAKVNKIADRINEYVDKNMSNEAVKVTMTGYAYVTAVVIELAVSGMMESIIISMVIIYFMATILFRSFKGGGFTIIPITMAMLLNFGLMGAVGITIGFANSVAFTVAMGIGVDYAIHLVFKFQHEVAENADLSEVNANTLRTTGRAILFNAIVVTAGFMVLITSDFTGHAIMGRLLSFSMVTSFLGSVTLLPAALSLFKPGFIFKNQKGASETS